MPEPWWGGELTALLEEAARADSSALPPATSLAEAVLAPFLAAAGERLSALLASRDRQVLDPARRDMLAILARRLTVACVRVLAHERQALEASAWLVGAAPQLDSGIAAWRVRFERFPELAPLVTGILLNWQRYLGELLSRLEADRALVSDTFFGGTPLSPLAGLVGDAGDLHDGGRSVVVLRFEDGRRVVYKPKDLRITRATLELCAFLNGAGLPLPLHVRGVCIREGYTWEEFVPAAPCRTAAEVERFYVRMGMLLRLFQLLEGRDLFLDNLVAAADHPVFIDLEMMLQPRHRAPSGGVAAPTAEALLSESVVYTGIPALNIPIAPGLPAEDFGALTPPRALLCPIPSEPACMALEGPRALCRDGHRVWKPTQWHAPVLDGEPTRATEYLGSLLEGYGAMHEVLRAQRESLLAPEGPLAGFVGLPVRYIHRGTWSYMRFLQASLTAGSLTSSGQRRIVLEYYLGRDNSLEDEANQVVTRVEMEALTGLDIPYFLCRTDGEALLGGGGQPLQEGFFEGTALERVKQRVQQVDAFPLALHEDILRSMLATGHHSPPPRAASGSEEEEASGSVDWLLEAVRLGEGFLEAAIQERTGPVWLGLSLDPLYDVERVDVLEPDILSGSTGLALVLADLYRVSRQERFRTAALGALSGTLEAARRAPTELARGMHMPSRTPFLEVGAFRGVGAWLYALSRCATALDEPALARAAATCASALPVEQLRARATSDVVIGITGLLLSLVACEAEPAARALAVELERPQPAVPTARAPFPAGGRIHRGFPSPASALNWCATRLTRRLGFTPRWDIPEPGASLGPADLLVQFETTPEFPPGRERLRASVLHFLEVPWRQCSTPELLDTWEVALVAAEVLGDAPFHEYAQRIARTLLARFRRERRWFPDSFAADRHHISALWGLPAIAHGFLRLHTPGTLPSLRLYGT